LMAIYTIADLHLPGPYGSQKSMDVFEDRWKDCVAKLEKRWRALVEPEDSVVIPGDISWALKPGEALGDLAFIDSLPGTKYLGKGNHDYWWSTVRNLKRMTENAGLHSLRFLYNNSFIIEGIAVVGARGWFPDETLQSGSLDADWKKISNREQIRLKLSISSLPDEAAPLPKVLFIHFPPVWRGYTCRGIMDIIHEAGIKTVYYGHIHGVYSSEGDFESEGVKFRMISADRLDFTPLRVYAE
ncbi:MAG: metallophosphoesterase, partial [Clostridia bacterium]|nr:metallophosphoesterase [Clostridia bacterium]